MKFLCGIPSTPLAGQVVAKKNNKEYTHEKLEKNISGSRSPR